MRLTPEDREEVVALLRCAAYEILRGNTLGQCALDHVGPSFEDRLWNYAFEAETDMCDLLGRKHVEVTFSDDRWAVLLEAAVLVEEGRL